MVGRVTPWEGLLRAPLLEVGAHRPGPSLDELLARHGLDAIDKLNWNEGLWGPLPGVLDAAAGALGETWAYPEHAYDALREAIAAETGARPDEVLPGHGVQALVLTLYAQACRVAGGRVEAIASPGLGFELERVAVLRTFSKIFGLAGLRLGYALADRRLVQWLHRVQEPFNVNRIALAAGLASLGRAAEVDERRRLAIRARDRLAGALRAGGMRPVDSAANFVLAELGVDDGELAERLLRRGILIRPGAELGLPGWARITVAPDEVMERAAAALLEVRAELLAAEAPAA
jgi:histidinol-phosphate/aromatic aminotransferase/cobyric acid decarboxylase-like protein